LAFPLGPPQRLRAAAPPERCPTLGAFAEGNPEAPLINSTGGATRRGSMPRSMRNAITSSIVFICNCTGPSSAPTIFCARPGRSKYPPAKPGALVHEPLKAAGKVCSDIPYRKPICRIGREMRPQLSCGCEWKDRAKRALRDSCYHPGWFRNSPPSHPTCCDDLGSVPRE
jgi:hypothetical protein